MVGRLKEHKFIGPDFTIHRFLNHSDNLVFWIMFYVLLCSKNEQMSEQMDKYIDASLAWTLY